MISRTQIEKTRPGPYRGFRALCLLFFLITLLFFTACSSESSSDQNTDDPSSDDESQLSTSSSDTVDQIEEVDQEGSGAADQSSSADLEEVQPEPVSPEEAWQLGAHSDSYVLSTAGKNDTCARCHSPAEWLPGPEDIPESCLTCKFDVDTPDPVISEEDWGHVPCKTCHKVKDGEVNPEYVWLDIAVIEEYIEVDSPSDLCGKCHEETEQLEHKPAISLSADHLDLDCTECHDAHSTTISCSGSDCHPDIYDPNVPVVGHDDDHATVTCLACHDGAGQEVGLDEERGEWVTLIELSRDGETGLLPHSSHTIQLEVACDRCHFPDNPWNLSGEVSASP